MADNSNIKTLASKLSRDVRELSLGTRGVVERIHGPPSPLGFLRDFVLPNKPCIISNAIDHWPAIKAWTNDHLRSTLQHQTVSVHFTPNGYADALVDLSHISAVHGCSVIDSGSPLLSSEGPSLSAEGEPQWHSDADSEQISSSDSCNPAKETQASSHQVPSSDAACSSLLTESSNERNGARRVIDDEMMISVGEDLHARARNVTKAILDGLSETCPSSTGEVSKHSADRVWFVTSHVERLPFPLALDMILQSGIGRGVAYAQEQNGCFLTEYRVLTEDAETHLPWATEAFGCLPESVNLWIGTEHAVTSFHKDHYENLYAVVAGEKHFTLLPPTDVHRLCIREYPAAHYQKVNGEFIIEQDKPPRSIPWVTVDPYPPTENKSHAQAMFPQYFDGPKPFTCTVHAGEVLYLPSMWFHHVRQSPDQEGRTIALNYWYDMQFDVKYAYFSFLEALVLNAPTK